MQTADFRRFLKQHEIEIGLEYWILMRNLLRPKHKIVKLFLSNVHVE